MITRHTKIVGVIALLLLVATLSALSGFAYVLSSAKEEFAKRQIEVARAHAHGQELAALARLVEKSTAEREQIKRYMLHEEDVIDFLSLLEQMGEEQGVGLEIKSLDVSGTDDAFEELQISLSAQGSYDAMLHFLKLLETLPHQSFVESVTFTRVSDVGGAWSGSFSLRVVKYKTEGT